MEINCYKYNFNFIEYIFLLVVKHPIPTDEAVRDVIDEFAIDFFRMLQTLNVPIRGIWIPCNRFQYLVSNAIVQVHNSLTYLPLFLLKLSPSSLRTISRQLLP